MEYSVRLDQVQEQLLAAARERTSMDRLAQDIPRLLERPWRLIRERGDLRTDGHNVAIYWGPAAGYTVEVGVQVASRFEATDLVVCSATPGGRVATATHVGPYSELRRAHAAVRDWCAQNGHAVSGIQWEVYGDWNDDPTKLRTDVLWLLA